MWDLILAFRQSNNSFGGVVLRSIFAHHGVLVQRFGLPGLLLALRPFFLCTELLSLLNELVNCVVALLGVDLVTGETLLLVKSEMFDVELKAFVFEEYLLSITTNYAKRHLKVHVQLSSDILIINDSLVYSSVCLFVPEVAGNLILQFKFFALKEVKEDVQVPLLLALGLGRDGELAF